MALPPDPPYAAALLAPTWLGDSVMSTALLPRLRAMSGGLVEVWSRPAFAPLFASHPDVGAVRLFDPRGAHRGLCGLLRWRREVRAAGRPDGVWILPDSLSSALAARFSGVRLRVGRPGDGRSPLLSRVVRAAPRQRKHWIEEQAELLAPFASEVDGAPPLEPRVHVPDEEVRTLSVLLEREEVALDAACVFIVGATYGPTKRWTGFADLARLLPEGTTVLLVGAEGDRPFTTPLAARLREMNLPARDLCCRLSLMQLAALLARVRCTVANDTGPMHLAAAVGGRVLGLFASTSPLWTRPRGAAAKWIEADLPCAPCFSKTCARGDLACLADITPERARQALEGWL